MISHYLNGSCSPEWLRELAAIRADELTTLRVPVPLPGLRMVGICRTCGADVPIAEFTSQQGCARCGGV